MPERAVTGEESGSKVACVDDDLRLQAHDYFAPSVLFGFDFVLGLNISSMRSVTT